MSQTNQVEHIFRHEYGQLVALLTRRFGIQYLDSIEDAVQWAMAKAIDSWRIKGVPDSPPAWLYRVAFRHVVSELRSAKYRHSLLNEYVEQEVDKPLYQDQHSFSHELTDSILRMLFVVCHADIPVESQLVFTLKSICGFSVSEISHRLFISEANVYKRFTRAKKQLKNETLILDNIKDDELIARLPAVQSVLYAVFTEGYLSSHADSVIRQDLCEEAMRLTSMLAESMYGNVVSTDALLALMYFNIARIDTRQDNYGALLLLEQQDRNKWDKNNIATALAYLDKSAQGHTISRYHIEAGIAAAHCFAPSFEQTNWQEITRSYQLLRKVSPSPLHILNEAIATAEWQGAAAGLQTLQAADLPHWLTDSYYWYTVKADLLYRSGNPEKSQEFAELAISLAPSDAIKDLLRNRLIKE